MPSSVSISTKIQFRQPPSTISVRTSTIFTPSPQSSRPPDPTVFLGESGLVFPGTRGKTTSALLNLGDVRTWLVRRQLRRPPRRPARPPRALRGPPEQPRDSASSPTCFVR